MLNLYLLLPFKTLHVSAGNKIGRRHMLFYFCRYAFRRQISRGRFLCRRCRIIICTRLFSCRRQTSLIIYHSSLFILSKAECFAPLRTTGLIFGTASCASIAQLLSMYCSLGISSIKRLGLVAAPS